MIAALRHNSSTVNYTHYTRGRCHYHSRKITAQVIIKNILVQVTMYHVLTFRHVILWIVTCVTCLVDFAKVNNAIITRVTFSLFLAQVILKCQLLIYVRFCSSWFINFHLRMCAFSVWSDVTCFVFAVAEKAITMI